MISISELWKLYGNRGRGSTVALLDTGIASTSKHYNSPNIQYRDFCSSAGLARDTSGHGTTCASIILNIAPECTFLCGRVMTSTGFFSYDALLDGFLWAVESGAEVVCIASGDKYVNPDFEKALQATARDRGTLVLAAVGNDGRSGEDAGMFPARCEHALAVGSVNHEGRLSTFTDLPLGKNVIAVPGENLMAESMSSEMAHYSGTSFAACVLAGWLAIWQGQRKMKNITKSLTSSEILAQCKGVESPRGPCYLFDPTRPLLAS